MKNIATLVAFHLLLKFKSLLVRESIGAILDTISIGTISIGTISIGV